MTDPTNAEFLVVYRLIEPDGTIEAALGCETVDGVWSWDREPVESVEDFEGRVIASIAGQPCRKALVMLPKDNARKSCRAS